MSRFQQARTRLGISSIVLSIYSVLGLIASTLFYLFFDNFVFRFSMMVGLYVLVAWWLFDFLRYTRLKKIDSEQSTSLVSDSAQS